MSEVFVIGGGAAGMMAAIISARNGHTVTIFEKNEKLGKKLYITGKGRCNITNACDIETLFSNVVTNKKFLYSSFYGFDNYNVIAFFEELGLKLKTERGGRVFPESDHSSDVIRVLEQELIKRNVIVKLHQTVTDLIIENQVFLGIKLNGEKKMRKADAVILATGGLSYPTTGSTGDGFLFSKKIGHTVTELSPALVPFHIKEDYGRKLQGLSLKNIKIYLYAGKKEIFSDFGEMLFTHFGVSGPVILSASSHFVSYRRKKKKEEKILLYVDLKPALSYEQLDNRIQRDFEEALNKQLGNALDHLLPKKMIPVMIDVCGLDPYKKVNSITKQERKSLVETIKHFPMHIGNLGDYKEAIITNGGIHVKEVNPSTMESQLVKGVYFAGEILDLDALTGGFNLQIAWSTAFVAGNAIE